MYFSPPRNSKVSITGRYILYFQKQCIILKVYKFVRPMKTWIFVHFVLCCISKCLGQHLAQEEYSINIC